MPQGPGTETGRSCRRPRGAGEELDVRVGLDVEHVDLEAAPERRLERRRRGIDRPRAVRDGAVAPDAVHHEPEVPVDHLVPDEEEVAPAQARCERDRDGRRDVRATEVVDVVVLGDDEALPLALGERVDRSMELEEDGAAVERQLRRIRVRDVDRARLLARERGARTSRETAPMRRTSRRRPPPPPPRTRARARGRTGSRRSAGAARRARGAAAASAARNRCTGCGSSGLLEAPVQLVVERARAVHRRDVLRDPGEVERAVARGSRTRTRGARRGRCRRRARAPGRHGPRRAP